MKEEELKELKEVEMEILDYFVSFCKKNNLKYYLIYGTLLGAVRHKGFIPWDDDIDVCMPPQDYQKFLQLFKSNDKYFLQNVKTEKYYHTIFSKIRKNNTCMVEEEWQYLNIHKGINIDVFPMIPYPENRFDKFIFNIKIRLALLLVSKNNKPNSLKTKIIFNLLKLIPRKVTNKTVQKIINSVLNYNKSFNNYIIASNVNLNFKKEWFDKDILVKFEDRKYKIPVNYDEILKVCYNDYMRLPKKEDRVGHGKIIFSLEKSYEDLRK